MINLGRIGPEAFVKGRASDNQASSMLIRRSFEVESPNKSYSNQKKSIFNGRNSHMSSLQLEDALSKLSKSSGTPMVSKIVSLERDVTTLGQSTESRMFPPLVKSMEQMKKWKNSLPHDVKVSLL